jgi:XRE family transcriptional regulator, regulator of sulfur utilization
MARSRSTAFGEALRTLRKERDDMSQEAAALACRVDRAYYGKIERGDKSPTLRTLWKLADGFETTPSDLLARAERLLSE